MVVLRLLWKTVLRSGHGRSHESSLLVEVSAHLVLAQNIFWLLLQTKLNALQTRTALCRADLLDHATKCQHSSFWGRGSQRAIQPERDRI